MGHVKEEIADVFIYLVRLSDKLDVDIEKAVFKKIELNEMRYPVELSKGDATKYSKRQRIDEVVASKKHKKGGHN
jgi:dCTP diphosphatase